MSRHSLSNRWWVLLYGFQLRRILVRSRPAVVEFRMRSLCKLYLVSSSLLVFCSRYTLSIASRTTSASVRLLQRSSGFSYWLQILQLRLCSLKRRALLLLHFQHYIHPWWVASAPCCCIHYHLFRRKSSSLLLPIEVFLRFSKSFFSFKTSSASSNSNVWSARCFIAKVSNVTILLLTAPWFAAVQGSLMGALLAGGGTQHKMSMGFLR